MDECLISRHCLFERCLSKVSYEFVDGVEHKRGSGLICSVMGDVEVVMHYSPFCPIIEVSLKFGSGSGIVLFNGRFDYELDYDSYLDYVLSDDDDDEELRI